MKKVSSTRSATDDPTRVVLVADLDGDPIDAFVVEALELAELLLDVIAESIPSLSHLATRSTVMSTAYLRKRVDVRAWVIRHAVSGLPTDPVVDVLGSSRMWAVPWVAPDRPTWSSTPHSPAETVAALR